MSNVPAKKEMATVATAIEAMKDKFAAVLPKHLPAERLVRVALMAVQNNPKLLECNRNSLYSALLTSAQLGLEPDGVMGQAYLVPFKGKVTFIPGYKGLITLARNSGEVVSIHAHEVRENDEFEWAYGLNERLEHRPARGNRGEIIYYYAYATFKDGGYIFEVMSKEEVLAIRNQSAGWQSAVKYNSTDKSPWTTHEVEMGRKTLIRRLVKYMPLDVQKASSAGSNYEAGEQEVDFKDMVDVTPPEEEEKPEEETTALEEFTKDEPEPEPEPEAEEIEHTVEGYQEALEGGEGEPDLPMEYLPPADRDKEPVKAMEKRARNLEKHLLAADSDVQRESLMNASMGMDLIVKLGLKGRASLVERLKKAAKIPGNTY